MPPGGMALGAPSPAFPFSPIIDGSGPCYVPGGWEAVFWRSHGAVGNAIILPHVMEFNLIASLERFANIAAALGAPCARGKTKRGSRIGGERRSFPSKDAGIPATLGRWGASPIRSLRLTMLLMNVNGIRLNPRYSSREDIGGHLPSSDLGGEGMPIINVAILEGRTS